MGVEITHDRPAAPHHAKTSEWERAGPKKRGGGGPPPATLCVRAFSRESLDPRPGPGGKPTPQVLTCAGPHPDHLPGAARYYVPFGWSGLSPTLGRSAPLPRLPGGKPTAQVLTCAIPLPPRQRLEDRFL